MIKSTFPLVSALIVLAVIVLSGCFKTPEKEMKVAQNAIEKTKQAQADRFAPVKFKAAMATLAEAKKEIAFQKKSMWIPDYNKAKRLLKKTVEMAGASKIAAEASPEKEALQTQQLFLTADSVIGGFKKILKKNRANIRDNRFLREMDADIKAIEQEIADLIKKLAQGGFPPNERIKEIIAKVVDNKERVAVFSVFKSEKGKKRR